MKLYHATAAEIAAGKQYSYGTDQGLTEETVTEQSRQTIHVVSIYIQHYLCSR